MIATSEPVIAKGNAAEGDSTTLRKRRGTLLVVDDEDGPRQSLRVIFKDEYNLLMAEDGPTAIELAKQHPIDVAVLDIRMAGMSGIEVLERLKYVNPNLEAVMMTAFETTDTIRQALRLRACDYINKPFEVATMRAAVGQAMQRRKLESEIHSSAEKVQELLNELQDHKIEEQMAKTRGDIYASIIHDINGPLTVISGFTQVLNTRLNRTPGWRRRTWNSSKTACASSRGRWETAWRSPGVTSVFCAANRRKPGSVSVNQLLKDLEQLIRVHPSLHRERIQRLSRSPKTSASK